MSLVVTTPADVLPCSMDRALRHVRAFAEEVDLVEFACRAAIAACEDYTDRIFIVTTFTLRLTDWPRSNMSDRGAFGLPGPGWLGPQASLPGPQSPFPTLPGVTLPRGPIVAINSLKYWPVDGTAQVTWGAGNYIADTVSLPGRLVFKDGVVFPSVARRPDAIEIEFTAGHGTVEASMPPNYMIAMLQLARHLYDNPSAVDADGKVKSMPLSFKSLLQSQKIHR